MRTFLVFGALGLFFYLSFVPPSGVSPMESVFGGGGTGGGATSTGASLSSSSSS